MGMISGVTNMAIDSFLGEKDLDIVKAFVVGYASGFGFGAVMYVAAAYEIMTIAEMCFVMAASDTVMSVVLSIVAVNTGNTKVAIVYGTLAILSFLTFCKLYNLNCMATIVGDKGSVRIEYNNPAEPHGNSKTSTKPQHGYEIYNSETGDVVKTGISGQPLNKNGTSPRANIQVNKLNKAVGYSLYEARVVEVDIPNRALALEWEKNNALRLWREGNSMSIHKKPQPWK